MRVELQVRFQEAVDGLEPLDRDILALRHYEELTNQEAADELGITAGGGQQTLHPRPGAAAIGPDGGAGGSMAGDHGS